MSTKLNIFSSVSAALRSWEWGGGVSSSRNPIQTSSCPETARGQAGQGRGEGGKGSALQCVTRRSATEDAEMRRAMRSLSAVGVVAVVLGTLLLAAPASALSKHTYSTSFGTATSTPSNPSPLVSPDYLAVDESNGDVYVSELGHSEVQTVEVSATGGAYTLTFEGQTTGATGRGDLTEGSSHVSGLTTEAGTFAAGEEISGPGVSAATGLGEITGATGHGDLTEGSNQVAGLTTEAGTFVAGEEISGPGISAAATITKVEPAGPGTLELSSSALGSHSAAALNAGSKQVTGLSTETGAFAVGQTVSGPGIPAATTIRAVGATSLTLSAHATTESSHVSLAAHTTVSSVGATFLTLSSPATSSSTASPLSAALAYDSAASEVQRALETLPTVGSADLRVSGGPGATAPYTIEFSGTLANRDLPQLTTDPSALTGPAHSATAATTTNGGGARVEKFSPSGEFLLMLGGDVDKTTGADLCTAESGDQCQAATPGSSPGAFQGNHTFGYESNALYLAVDNSPGGEGDVYVGDAGDALVSKFDSSGHLITTWGGTPAPGQLDGSTGRGGPFSAATGTVEGVAVDPTEGALVVLSTPQIVHEFTPAGSWLATAESPNTAISPYGVAVDPAGDIYLTAGTPLPHPPQDPCREQRPRRRRNP